MRLVSPKSDVGEAPPVQTGGASYKKGTIVSEQAQPFENPAAASYKTTVEQPVASLAPASLQEVNADRRKGWNPEENASARVAIIGAGPYGLSIAAHLRAAGVPFRIFGRAMESWSERMPAGMLLKSEGFASTLYDPEGELTLEKYCMQHGLPYADEAVPIPLETMVDYGRAFQQRFVPNLEERYVVELDRTADGFTLRLDDGQTLKVQNVIVASGYMNYQNVPPTLKHLPPEFLSHTSNVQDPSQFKGRDVTVVGGGASALELATLLREAGAEVRVVVRQQSVEFNTKPLPRPLWYRLRYPLSGLGRGWKTYLLCEAPYLFRPLARETRLRVVKQTLGPAGGWPVKDRFEGKVPLLAGQTIEGAEVRDGRVYLQLSTAGGACSEVVTDHVIAGTGYVVDARRIRFLSDEIRSALRLEGTSPVLSGDFESSVPGLYFVGITSANFFGPVMRFVAGAKYTARHLAKHISRVTKS